MFFLSTSPEPQCDFAFYSYWQGKIQSTHYSLREAYFIKLKDMLFIADVFHLPTAEIFTQSCYLCEDPHAFNFRGCSVVNVNTYWHESHLSLWE